MKKYIILLSAAALALSACTKESPSNPYDRVSSISISESNILFEEDGGEGTITVKCDQDYTVECNSSWISCAKEGLTVSVKATQNNTILGRSASILLRCGQDSVKAVAQQVAFDFRRAIPEEISWDDSEADLTYEYRAPYTVKLQSTADWCRVAMVGDDVRIVLTENTTGTARLGKIYLRGPEEKDPVDSISVSQYDFDGHIAGLYDFEYETVEYNEEAKKWEKVQKKEDAVISRDPDTHEVSLTLVSGWSIPMRFDPANMAIAIDCFAYLGVEKTGSSTYYIYTTMVDSQNGTMICGDIFGLVAPITYNGFGKVYLKFVDNGVWGTYMEGFAADSFYLYRFTNTPPDYQYSAGSMATYYYPVLTKQ